jgi:hypothetical protein
MKFELVSKTSKEVIDVVDTLNVDVNSVKKYFMGRKQLREQDFDKLFVVKENPNIGRYDWWKEENPNLDDF